MNHPTGYIKSTEPEIDKLYSRLSTLAPGMYGRSLDASDVARDVAGKGEGKLSLPYLHTLQLDSGAFQEVQTQNDCCSFAQRSAADISRSCDIAVKMQPEEWVGRGATEHIYGARGEAQDGGMMPARAMQFMGTHGVLVRKKYGFADLSKYNGRLGVSWGRYGFPDGLAKEAKKSPCEFYCRVTSVEMARDLLACGYGLLACTWHWFSGRRNSSGVSEIEGTTAHAVTLLGCDDTGTSPLFLMGNSWPHSWTQGGHPEWGQLPPGSTLVRADSVERWTGGDGELWAIGEAAGFPAREIPDYGFGAYL